MRPPQARMPPAPGTGRSRGGTTAVLEAVHPAGVPGLFAEVRDIQFLIVALFGTTSSAAASRLALSH